MYQDGQKVRMADVSDGLSNTMMMIEVKDYGVNWAEPRDVDLSRPVPLPAGNHGRTHLVLMGDGSVKVLTSDLKQSEVRAMATIAGSEIQPSGGFPVPPQAPLPPQPRLPVQPGPAGQPPSTPPAPPNAGAPPAEREP
jgi:hypothetical protein